jgi:PAS domain-containing protein
MGTIQTLPSTVSGEVTPRLLGRVDVGFWKRAAQTLENFVLWPQGPLQSRPGTQHLQAVKDSSKAVRNIAFIVSETVSYNLEVGDKYIRFYKEDTVTGPGRIENPPGTPVELVTPYLEAELFDIQVQQSIDVMYLVHPNHAPRKLTRFSDTTWTLTELVFNPPPTEELPVEPAADITLSALTGDGATITASAGVFQSGDVQRVVKAGTGRATITAFTSSTVVTIDIIDDFDSLNYTSGNWTIEGSPFGEITPSASSPEGGIITIESTGQTESVTNLIGAAACADWTAAGAGLNEYYLLNTAAGYTATEPDKVRELSTDMVKGSIGSLGIGQWGWGDGLVNLIGAVGSCPTADWALSGSGTNEYYLLNTAAGYTATEPDGIKQNGNNMGTGTLGSLGIGTWDWGDNDALGYDTIYVRLSGAIPDPDSYCGDEDYLQRTGALGYNTIHVRLTDETDPDSKCGDLDYLQRVTIDISSDLFRLIDEGKYIYLNGGLTKITTYVSETEVKAEILRELDNTTPTFSWTLEDEIWSATFGYPATIAFHEGRLFFGRTATFPQTVWASVSDDFVNFATGANAADSFKFTLSGPQNNQIKWMVSRQDLLIGTEGAEWIVRSSGSILTPSDVSAKIQTTNGSHGIQPVIIDSSVLHVQRKARKLRELSFDFVVDSYISPDMTILAEHVTSGGMVQMAYAEEPLKTLWIVRGDGELLGFTFMRDEQVIAWHRHIAAGSFGSGNAVIESVAVTPHPTDDYDQIWIIVKRTIDGNTTRSVEVFKKLFDSDDSSNSWALDSAAEYSGVATKTITGLDHLEGETVSVVNLTTNGSYVGDFVVSGGSITLTNSVTNALIGLKYTCTVKKLPMTIDIGAQGIGQKKVMKRFILSLYRTIGGKVGFGTAADQTIRFKSRDGTMSMSQVATMKTGNTDPINVPGGVRPDWEAVVQQDLPLPMTLLAMLPEGDYTSGTDG